MKKWENVKKFGKFWVLWKNRGKLGEKWKNTDFCEKYI